MPKVYISTGPNSGFNAELDRIPVVGDLVMYQNQNYPIQAVLLIAGGGAQAGAGTPQQAESRTDASAPVPEPAAD
ncbi:MAG: hypothetical protein QOG72_2002 [Sphingomonadales bacterium]|nr:hypothetical protein [Sphingomonadales bacterium]